MSDNTWLAFPSNKNCKIWIRNNDRVRNALKLYNPYSHKGKLIKHLFSILPNVAAIMCLPKARSANSADALCELIYSAIDRDTQAFTISISRGTPGPHQKATAIISLPNKPPLFAKIARTPASRNLIYNEKTCLEYLPTINSLPFSIPGIYRYKDYSDASILIQIPHDASTRPVKPTFSSNIIDAAVSLSQLSRNKSDIKSFLSKAVTYDYQVDKHDRQTLTNAHGAIIEHFKNNDFVTHFSHGDFTPWNMYLTGDNNLYIIDWEYARHNQAGLFDIIHFNFMHDRLVQGLNADVIIENTLATTDFYPYLNATGIDSKSVPYYFLIYLLLTLDRSSDNKTIDQYIINCIHKLLVRINYTLEPLRVLVSAYACEPDEGSEPGVGWNMTKAIASQHRTWAITRSNNIEKINHELLRNPVSSLNVLHTDLPRSISFWKKGGRGIRLYYYLWQFFALRTVKKQSVEFDIGHHITFVNDYTFTFLAFMKIPYVWGPIGSNSPWPRSLVTNKKAYMRDNMRIIIQSMIRTLDPLYWLSIKRSSLVIGVNNSIGKHLPVRLLANHKFITHCAIGVEKNAIAEDVKESSNTKFTVVTMGRLLPVKGFILSLHAFKYLADHHSNCQLVIIGDGPEKNAILDTAKKLGIIDIVTRKSWMPRQDALDILKSSDVFLYPSFEGSGMVTLEAMACGTPVVGLNFGGVGSMVSDSSGIKIAVSTFDETIKQLGNALLSIANNNALQHKLSSNAIQHVNNSYLWEKRIIEINTWYRMSLSRRN